MAIALPVETVDDGDEPIFADINITPLTDVFLVLVVIFMVSAIAVQVQSKVEKRAPRPAGIVVNPPPGRNSESYPVRSTLVLELPKSGGVYIGGRPFTDDQLDNVLRVAARDPQTHVLVRADRGIQYGRVVQVIERARGFGLGHVVIGVSTR